MDIKEKLAKKRKRKYALIAVGLLVAVGVLAAVLSIEPADSKLEGADDKTVTSVATDDKSQNSNANKSESEDASAKEAKDIKIDNSKNPTASNKGNRELKPKKAEKVTVTVEIRCDTVLKNMDKAKDEIVSYIPKDGVILAKTSYKGTTDNCVFDAVNAVCRNNNIQIEYKRQSGYDSYYVKGIGFIYEGDFGATSGWIYKVNGWMPNYGCSNYFLHDGDEIVWHYSVKGLGKDL